MIEDPKIKEIFIYTDGSCHTQKRVGAWAAILIIDKNEIILQGNEIETTHNRMELLGVIKAIEYIIKNHQKSSNIQLITDSQYVIGIPERAQKLSANDFITKKGNALHNADLIKTLMKLLIELPVSFNKIKAHQKEGDAINFNIVADKISRSIVRDLVKNME